MVVYPSFIMPHRLRWSSSRVRHPIILVEFINFIHALSYTTFTYLWINQSTNSIIFIDELQSSANERALTVQFYRVNVTNTDDMAGSDVILVFVTRDHHNIINSWYITTIEKLIRFSTCLFRDQSTNGNLFSVGYSIVVDCCTRWF